ncbi:hypothetical protein SPRG_09231 [Saprolegnia parasitica CBS 223.65]|uniref:Uncharacterized protein n=1 Tax=Saprolegnia parasitica (strain CBS 223.65) TaxID=695850 RepID=A0A067C7E5_SAPPC|nr:hypothetical protein SPRG_09231 [Saprolegnia parasitica CBS 223.65]KDO25090.1 hypothetical protein SPRG_09231 [Saprolegnia parasitica CBS 223.65]|eukprot:XP_012204164.1 hypothetical protein SPRG_09231 [Saprolegnia parasitica CBS 223.65]
MKVLKKFGEDGHRVVVVVDPEDCVLVGADHFAAFLEPCHGNPLARMGSSKSQSHESITSSALLHTWMGCRTDTILLHETGDRLQP